MDIALLPDQRGHGVGTQLLETILSEGRQADLPVTIHVERFNPVLQGEKFDPEGVYVRRWVPELARLSNEFIHKPWLAPPDALRTAGIELGRDYPAPMVDHGAARDRALAALKSMK
jgi:deoxyribodipyrimidine photolyase